MIDTDTKYEMEIITAQLQLMNYYVQLNDLISSPTKNLQAIQNAFFKYVTYLNSTVGSKYENNILQIFSHLTSDFQKLSQQVEMVLEILFAQSIIHGESSLSNYMNERYRKIIQSEKQLIEQYIGLKSDASVLFCGGGPLPISSILMAEDQTVTITLLDNNSLACSLAKSIVHQQVDLHNIKLLPPISVEDYTEYHQFDAILIAAMVGNTREEKIRIYAELATKLPEGTYIFTRAANPTGISILQYDSFPFDELSTIYRKVVFKPIAPDVTVYNVVLQRI